MSDRSAIEPRLLPCGDCAFLVEFGDRMDRAVSERILGLNEQLLDADLQGLTETLPAFRSLLVRYDPMKTGFAELAGKVRSILVSGGHVSRPSRHWDIPVCYDAEFAPDLADVADAAGMTPTRVIDLHIGVLYHVYMIGFVAGYPYLGDLPEALSLPRRTDPRVRVPPGSIAIALTMAAIYPLESPGGWHLIGQTPVRIFDPALENPALFAPGDRIRFMPVGREEARRLHDAVRHDGYRIEPRRAAA